MGAEVMGSQSIDMGLFLSVLDNISCSGTYRKGSEADAFPTSIHSVVGHLGLGFSAEYLSAQVYQREPIHESFDE